MSGDDEHDFNYGSVVFTITKKYFFKKLQLTYYYILNISNLRLFEISYGLEIDGLQFQFRPV